MKTRILMYHGVEDKQNEVHNYDGKHISNELFEQQIKYINNNYNVIPLRLLIDYIDGQTKLPKKPLVITFDDGYENNYTNAFPILKKYKLPATVFLITSYLKGKLQWTDELEFALEKTKEKHFSFNDNVYSIENTAQKKDVAIQIKKILKNINQHERDKLVSKLISDLDVKLNINLNPSLSKDQIKEMSFKGIDFGNHTENHYILPKLDMRLWDKEVNKAKKEIEKLTGKDAYSFAYPDGNYNTEVLNFVREEHRCALTTEYGFNELNVNPFKLKRIAVDKQEFLFFKSSLNFNVRKGVSALNKIRSYVK